LLLRGENGFDRWGTYLRARSAQAAARFRADPGQRDWAASVLQAALLRPLGFAGFATAALLAQANCCLELGPLKQPVLAQPEGRPTSLTDAAAASAAYVRDPGFRARRVLLVHAYVSEWLPSPAPLPAEVAARLDQMPDRAMRLAYLDHLSARWASAGETNWPGLKALVPLALSDATTCDAVLARLVAARWRTLTAGEIDGLIEICARDLATGRSWEHGAQASASDPGIMA
jgi:hypothetical protein